MSSYLVRLRCIGTTYNICNRFQKIAMSYCLSGKNEEYISVVKLLFSDSALLHHILVDNCQIVLVV